MKLVYTDSGVVYQILIILDKTGCSVQLLKVLWLPIFFKSSITVGYIFLQEKSDQLSQKQFVIFKAN